MGSETPLSKQGRNVSVLSKTPIRRSHLREHRSSPYATTHRATTKKQRELQSLGLTNNELHSYRLAALPSKIYHSVSSTLVTTAKTLWSYATWILGQSSETSASSSQVSEQTKSSNTSDRSKDQSNLSIGASTFSSSHPMSMLDVSLIPHKPGMTPAPVKNVRQHYQAQAKKINRIDFTGTTKADQKNTSGYSTIPIYISDVDGDEETPISSPLSNTAHPPISKTFQFNSEAKLLGLRHVVERADSSLEEVDISLDSVSTESSSAKKHNKPWTYQSGKKVMFKEGALSTVLSETSANKKAGYGMPDLDQALDSDFKKAFNPQATPVSKSKQRRPLTPAQRRQLVKMNKNTPRRHRQSSTALVKSTNSELDAQLENESSAQQANSNKKRAPGTPSKIPETKSSNKLGPKDRFHVEFAVGRDEEYLDFLEDFNMDTNDLRVMLQNGKLPQLDPARDWTVDEIDTWGRILGDSTFLRRNRIPVTNPFKPLAGSRASGLHNDNLPVVYIPNEDTEPEPKYKIRTFSQQEQKEMAARRDWTPLRNEWKKQTRYDWVFADPSIPTPDEDKEIDDNQWEISRMDPRMRHTPLEFKGDRMKQLTDRLELKSKFSRADVFWHKIIKAVAKYNKDLAKRYARMNLERKRNQVHWDEWKRVRLVVGERPKSLLPSPPTSPNKGRKRVTFTGDTRDEGEMGPCKKRRLGIDESSGEESPASRSQTKPKLSPPNTKMTANAVSPLKRKALHGSYQDSLKSIPKEWRQRPGTFSAWSEDLDQDGWFFEADLVDGKLPKGVGNWEADVNSDEHARKRVKLFKTNGEEQEMEVWSADGTIKPVGWVQPSPAPTAQTSKETDVQTTTTQTTKIRSPPTLQTSSTTESAKSPEKEDVEPALPSPALSSEDSRARAVQPEPKEQQQQQPLVSFGEVPKQAPTTFNFGSQPVSSSTAPFNFSGSQSQKLAQAPLSPPMSGDEASGKEDGIPTLKLADIATSTTEPLISSSVQPPNIFMAAKPSGGTAEKRLTSLFAPPAAETSTASDTVAQSAMVPSFGSALGSTPLFGVAPVEETEIAKDSAPSFVFGSAPAPSADKGTSGASIFAAPSKPFSFGQTTGTTEKTANIFGSINATTKPAESAPLFQFGTTSATAPSITAATSQPFTFGSSLSTAQSSQPVQIFSSFESNASDATTTTVADSNVLQPLGHNASGRPSSLEAPKSGLSLLPSPDFSSGPTSAPSLITAPITSAEMNMFGSSGVKASPGGMELDNTPKSSKIAATPKRERDDDNDGGLSRRGFPPMRNTSQLYECDTFKPSITPSFDFGASATSFGGNTSLSFGAQPVTAVAPTSTPFKFGGATTTTSFAPTNTSFAPATTSSFNTSITQAPAWGQSFGSINAAPKFGGELSAAPSPIPTNALLPTSTSMNSAAGINGEDPNAGGFSFGFQPTASGTKSTAGGTLGRNIKKPISRLVKGGSLRRIKRRQPMFPQ